MNRTEKTWMRLAILGAVAVGSSVLTMAADKVVVVPLSNSYKVANLEARVAELEALLDGVSRTSTKMVFRGMNVQIVDGSGDTDGTVNGLGNLIIGYNEARDIGNDRSGSHNLIIGERQNFSSYGGLVAGYENSVSGTYASVSGGDKNKAGGTYSSVSGGAGNDAYGVKASVSGGSLNNANGELSSVSGGYINTAWGKHSSMSSGRQNLANGEYSSVSGGFSCEARDLYSSVSGGSYRYANGSSDWAAGSLWEDY